MRFHEEQRDRDFRLDGFVMAKKKKKLEASPGFPVWEGGKCGHCGHQADMDGDEPFSYRLNCPECYRDGCEECMPFGRGCRCPECEDSNER